MLKRVKARVVGAEEMQEAEHLLNVLASKAAGDAVAPFLGYAAVDVPVRGREPHWKPQLLAGCWDCCCRGSWWGWGWGCPACCPARPARLLDPNHPASPVRYFSRRPATLPAGRAADQGAVAGVGVPG